MMVLMPAAALVLFLLGGFGGQAGELGLEAVLVLHSGALKIHSRHLHVPLRGTISHKV